MNFIQFVVREDEGSKAVQPDVLLVHAAAAPARQATQPGRDFPVFGQDRQDRFEGRVRGGVADLVVAARVLVQPGLDLIVRQVKVF